MVIKEDLKKSFEELGWNATDNDILERCSELCEKYDINAELLVEKWVEFTVACPMYSEPTILGLTQMEKEELNKESDMDVCDSDLIKQEVESNDILEMYGAKKLSVLKPIKKEESPTKAQNSDDGVKGVDSTFLTAVYVEKDTHNQSGASTNVVRGKLLFKFGRDIPHWQKEGDYKVKIRKFDGPHVPNDALNLFQTSYKQMKSLASVYDELSSRVRQAWSKTRNTDVYYSKQIDMISQKKFITWGRIWSDVDETSNVTSIFLEGFTKSLFDASIEMDLSEVKRYSIFPGQIVAVECTNAVGNVLNVTELFSKIYAPMPDPPKIQEKVKIFVSAGSFTSSDNLDYQPLWDLMEHVVQQEPDVLILIGPLVDSAHSEIANSSIKDTFEQLFERLVTKIAQYLKGKSTQVVFVPSDRDAHHTFVFPTPQYFFPSKLEQDIPNLHFMPDPCTLDINGLVVGITSVDIVKHIGSEEITNISGADRMGRLADHVLSQSNFYPLYPPSLDVNVDTILWEKYAFFNYQPHILILPSDMHYYCKTINNCVVLNPERLHKYTYARLCIHPTTEKWNTSDVSCEIAKV